MSKNLFLTMKVEGVEKFKESSYLKNGIPFFEEKIKEKVEMLKSEAGLRTKLMEKASFKVTGITAKIIKEAVDSDDALAKEIVVETSDLGNTLYEVANFYDPGVIGIRVDGNQEIESLLAAATTYILQNIYIPVSTKQTEIVLESQVEERFCELKDELKEKLRDVLKNWTPYELTGGEEYAIGIDLGGFNIGVMVVEVSTGKPIYEDEVRTPESRKAEPVVEEIKNQIKLAKEFLKEKAEVDGKPNFAIGIGVPGPIYSEEGIIENLTNFDPKGSWRMFPVKKEIEDAIGAPTFGDNDANCAAIAVIQSLSRWGIKIADIIVLTLGMGIGQGIIKERRVFHGLKGAGEGGHFTAKKLSKELLLSLLGKNFKEKLASSPLKDALCNCGNYMCLEKLASANNIARLAFKLLRKEIALRGKIQGETMLSMALEKIDALCIGRAALYEDPIANEVLKEMGRQLAKAIKRMYDMSGISTFAFVGNMATITGDTPTGALVRKNTNKALKEIYGRDKEAPIKILWLPPDVEGRKAGSMGGAALAIQKIELRKETKGLS